MDFGFSPEQKAELRERGSAANRRLTSLVGQAYERVANNFSNSPWGDEARYGMGWAMQQQKNYDGAVNAARLSLMASQVSYAFATKTRVDPATVWNATLLPPAAELAVLKK